MVYVPQGTPGGPTGQVDVGERSKFEPAPPFNINVGPAEIAIQAKGQAMQHLAQAFGKMGDDATNVVLQGLQLKNTSEARDLTNQYMLELGNRENAFYQLEGKSAQDGLPDYTKSIQDLRTDFLGRASNPQVKRMLDSEISNLTNRSIIYGARHAGEQMKKYSNDISQARQEQLDRDVGLHPEDDYTFQQAVQKKRAEVLNQLQQHGLATPDTTGAQSPEDVISKLPPDQRKVFDFEWQKQNDALWSARIDALINQKKPGIARELYEAHKSEMSLGLQDKVERRLNGAEQTTGANDIVEQTYRGERTPIQGYRTGPETYTPGKPQNDSALLKSRLVDGKGPESIDNLNPTFQQRLAEMYRQAPPDVQKNLRIKSGYRSNEHQAELYAEAVKKYGPDGAAHWVAPPGHSEHNKGEAVDLDFSKNKETEQWVHLNAARFGLKFPMGHEPWHIEPVETRGQGKLPSGPMAQISGATRDRLIRTIYGEAGGEDKIGREAVMHVIQNRLLSGRYGKTIDDVLKPSQFEGMKSANYRALDPNSEDYKSIGQMVDDVLAGKRQDMTGGATHFYSPVAQAFLGRQPPSWGAGQPTYVHGTHRFYAPEGTVNSSQFTPVQYVGSGKSYNAAQMGPGGLDDFVKDAVERAQKAYPNNPDAVLNVEKLARAKWNRELAQWRDKTRDIEINLWQSIIPKPDGSEPKSMAEFLADKDNYTNYNELIARDPEKAKTIVEYFNKIDRREAKVPTAEQLQRNDELHGMAANEPDKFAEVSLADEVAKGRINIAHYNTLRTLQDAVIGKKGAMKPITTSEITRALGGQQAVQGLLGIKPSDDPQEYSKTLNQFTGRMIQELQSMQEEQKKPVDDGQIQKLAYRLIRDVYTDKGYGGYFRSSKKGFQFNLDATERSQIINALRARGVPRPSEDQILDLYYKQHQFEEQ